MIDCPNGEIRDLLPDLLHDRLGEADRARVQRHVDSCDACRAELALLRELRGTLRTAPVIDVATIAAAIPPYRAPVRRAWGGWRAAAAIAALVVGGASVVVLGRNGGPAEVARSIETPSPGGFEQPTGTVATVVPSARRQDSASEPRSAQPAAVASADPGALAMAGGAIGELSDGELATLLDELETLDALPSEDVDTASELAESIPEEGTR